MAPRGPPRPVRVVRGLEARRAVDQRPTVFVQRHGLRRPLLEERDDLVAQALRRVEQSVALNVLAAAGHRSSEHRVEHLLLAGGETGPELNHFFDECAALTIAGGRTLWGHQYFP